MSADIEAIRNAITNGHAIVCYAKCWSCNSGQHPGGQHSWADQDDIDHALATGQPDPSTSTCGCPCVTDAAMVTEEEPPPPDMDALTVEPCPLCGETGACSYDDQGRPLIHALPVDCEDEP